MRTRDCATTVGEGPRGARIHYVAPREACERRKRACTARHPPTDEDAGRWV